MSELPKGWALTTLGDIVSPRGEKALPVELGDARFIGMDHIEAHTSRLLDTQPVSGFKSAVTLFKKGDILYGRLRPYLNKVYEADFDGAASAEFIVLPESPVVERRFLALSIRDSNFVDFASQRSTGDRPRVKFESISDYPIPLPPLPEQRRIVAKLDSLFERTRRAREELSHISRLIENYRKAILTAAFRGDLTKDWRENNPVAITGEQFRHALLQKYDDSFGAGNSQKRHRSTPPDFSAEKTLPHLLIHGLGCPYPRFPQRWWTVFTKNLITLRLVYRF